MKIIITFLTVFSVLCSAFSGYAEDKVCIKDICIKVETASSPETRAQGLMYRSRLVGIQGMLFIFESDDKYTFWMKNMKFPLDIIWINKDNIIVDIKENVPPCVEFCESLAPAQDARYVLEVLSGFVEKHSVEIGDKVDLSGIK